MRSCQRPNVRRREIIMTFASFCLLLLILNSTYTMMDVALPPHDAVEKGLFPKRPPPYINSKTEKTTEKDEEEASSSMMVPQEAISDEAVRLHFFQEVLLKCSDKWAAAGGINYTLAKKVRRRRVAGLLGGKESPNLSSWWSYDDVIRDTVDPGPCANPRKQTQEEIVLTHACDLVSTPPFNDIYDAACIHLAKLLLTAAVASHRKQPESNVTGPPAGWQIFIPLPRAAKRYFSWDRSKNMNFNTKKGKSVDFSNLYVWVQLDILVPYLDQRTIKFRSKLCFCLEVKWPPKCLARMAFIVKVPQWQFNKDPFAEVAAFAVDRKLGMRRVPPTFLFPIPLAILQVALNQRSQRYIHMPNFFVRGAETKTYEKWVQNDVFLFLQTNAERGSGSEVYTRRGGLEAWCSFQIKIPNVTPLLSSPLRVPYGKEKIPGWHRWFNPLYKEVVVPHASLAALSEQVMFDYILGNGDRSPNKNSFVVSGCQQWGCLGDSAICSKGNNNRSVSDFPTIVHLDHGLAFRRENASLGNNPLAKPRGRQTFCMFYKPLLWRLWSIEKQLTRRHANFISGVDWSPCEENVDVVNRKNLWTNFLMANISSIVCRAVGKKAFEASGKRIVRLLQSANECLSAYPLEVVFLP
ncbi:hypothetical protein TcCL_ESM02612 [Trypanosoma cruzi]|uniref:Uncharacterized protein n=1 Tax=Trypanosoma cruzi (strain CL Brener) TaxID=353153 RepID=Q4DBU6_TRYCC|nr:hypothetical protein Tc00.1047053506567.20 [Trypanosoma cruzi]EAN89986.1 hypothetical protein Tc00.1047053506567.20 [Trypanosoma cruzi]RNC59699.1 hypothetical protein TcCL_ESM02612 [Trypanosoma cruzi]|eukprot:XP_811837.1 hypothetical protein [Trypanosoma cruzi strain CL Brener]